MFRVLTSLPVQQLTGGSEDGIPLGAEKRLGMGKGVCLPQINGPQGMFWDDDRGPGLTTAAHFSETDFILTAERLPNELFLIKTP